MTQKYNARHGDVLIVATNDKPQGDKQEKLILAYGEVTGHSHQITDGKAELFKWNEKTYLKVISDYATLNHEEHKMLKIPQGNYEIIIQEEWQEDGWTKVID